MKIHSKLVLYFLVSIMVITFFTPVSAEVISNQNIKDSKICESLGILLGDGTGLTDSYLSQTPTRIEAAVLYLRLKGLEKEALAFTSNINFDDANKAKWATNVMAYLKAHPEHGMIGVGDNKFSPDTSINVQSYYKILLESLGYKAGEDFQWENTITFAASKGLYKVANTTKFTRDNLATATIEALKTLIKNKVETLAGSLVKIGKFSSNQIEILKSSGVPLLLINLELSANTSSSLLVKFDKGFEDVTQISFSVLKDSLSLENVSGKWNINKNELVLSKGAKLDAGEYVVSVFYQGVIIGTKTIVVEAEKIVSLKLTPKVIVLTSDIKGEASYKAYNQYNEDVSNSYLVQNIVWTSTADSITADIKNTKLIVTKNGVPGESQLKDLKNIFLAGYNTAWKTSITEQVEISNGYGLIKDIKFTGISNKNGKTEISVDTNEKFYIEFEALDSEGSKIDNYIVLNNIANIGLFSSNPAIAAHFVRNPDNISKALLEIDTHTASGIAEISAIALTTGKTASIKVDVKRGSVLTDFVVEVPTAGLLVNERVEIPYKAYDQYGKLLNEFDQINGKILIISSDPAGASIIGERAQDGKYVLAGRFKDVKQYSFKVMIIESTKIIDFTIQTKPASIPTTLSVINKDAVFGAIVENGQIKVDFVNNPGFKILDQNNNEFKLSENNMVATSYYYINAIPLDKSKVSIFGSYAIAYKDNEILLVGGAVRGSTSVSFELCRDNDLNPLNGKEVLDVKDVSINNVDKKDIAKYEFEAIPSMYANPEIEAKETYLTVSKQKQQYATNIKIFGRLQSGEKVALSPIIGVGNNILNLSVTDANKFSVNLENKKLLAKSIGNDNYGLDKLTATIMGANGVISTMSTDIKSTKEIPIAQSVLVELKKDSQIIRAGDSFTCLSTTFNSMITGYEIRKFDASGNDAQKAELAFVIKDQYGNTALTPSYFAITKTQGNGTVNIVPNTGLVTGLAASGDQYIITVVTNNGITKAITINIQ